MKKRCFAKKTKKFYTPKLHKNWQLLDHQILSNWCEQKYPDWISIHMYAHQSNHVGPTSIAKKFKIFFKKIVHDVYYK